MIIIYIIYSVIASISVLLLSLFFSAVFFWFLFLPQYKRFKIFYFIVAVPWIFIVMRFFLFTRIKIIGKKYVNMKRTSLYICNHQSWVDVPVFIRYAKAIGISKKEVRRIPLVGLLIIYAGTVFFDRVDKSSRMGLVKEILKAFKEGNSFMMFPEGTRSKDGKLLEPNLALIKLSHKLKIPVIPAAIEGTRDILPRNRIYFKFFKKVVLKFNEPIDPKDYDNVDEFSEVCWQKVKESHKEIVNEYFPKKRLYN